MNKPQKCDKCVYLMTDSVASRDRVDDLVWFVCTFDTKRARVLTDEHVKDGPVPLWCPLAKGLGVPYAAPESD